MKNITLFWAFLFAAQIGSAQDFSDVTINAKKLTDHIFMLTGRGGNIAACIGDDGVILVDDQYAPLSEKIKAAVAVLSDQAVKYVINTHWHGDHAGGNENFGNEGAIIIAHENVRKRLSTEQLIQAFGRKVPPSAEEAWPVITFTRDIILHLNGEDIIIQHFHSGHTDGDAIIFFVQSNVVHMGDTYFKGRFPFLDVSSGGQIDGMIKTIGQVLQMTNEHTQIIPGHGELSNRKELIAYQEMLITVSDRVKKAIADGLAIEQIKAADLTAEYNAEWGTGFINPERFIDLLYSDLSRKDGIKQ